MPSHAHSVQEPRWHRRVDLATGALLFAMIIFSAWAFGGWPPWSIWTMNFGGYLLGLLFLIKFGIRRRTGYEPLRWGGRQPVAVRYGLGSVTVILLLWCLLSAVNARAVVDLENLRLIERPRWIAWLPHSFDQPSTWSAFWQYLGLAGVFWALHDWISVASPMERRLQRMDAGSRTGGFQHRVKRDDFWRAHRLPHRIRRWMWVVCLNGGAVALIGIISTLDDPSRVLWLRPHEVREGGFFGPFYYRNNGAQYVNLIWPLCLGLWLTYCLRASQGEGFIASFGRSPSAILPVCLALMIAAPLISSSRGGSIIAVLAAGACVPILLLSMRTSRGVLLLVGFTVLVGGSLGAWLAWEPLKQRFFLDFVAYPTGVEGRLTEFTLRSTFRIPSTWGRQAATFAGLSDSPNVLWNTPGSMTLSLRRPGVFEARFVETDRTRVLTLMATNTMLAESGRTVEVIFTHRARESALYLNGEPLEMQAVRSRAGFEWPEVPASKFLWVGRGAGGSMKFNDRIEAVTLIDRVLPDPLLRDLAERDPQPGWIIGANLWDDRWAELDPRPRVDVRPFTLSPSQWLATGLSGRADLYDLSRRMMADYPPATGTGPGTFAALFKVFRQDRNPAVDWYVHDDFLETRITFGLVGAALIYTGLLLCPIAGLCRGGLSLPWYVLALAVIGLAGGLFHARFDWVFQNHALLFVGVMYCAVIAASSIRRAATVTGGSS